MKICFPQIIYRSALLKIPRLKRVLIIAALSINVACSSNNSRQQIEQEPQPESPVLVNADYELFIPKKQDGLLILFPCYPCNATNTRNEFPIVELAIDNNIAVLLMNFNQRLWLSTSEKTDLESIIVNVASRNNLNTENTYIGGFSGGGNVSLLLTDYLKSSGSAIQPKGVFMADSPVDLLTLYENAQRTIEKNFSAPAMQEANHLIERFELSFGVGDTAFVHYSKMSPYLSKTRSTKNLSNLSDVKIRLYSEPDTLWWKVNRLAEYEDMNAFYIEQLANDLSILYGEEMVEYIKTKNRGYRANGDRHPHSWAIIDEKELVSWMLGK